ncbi:MAG: hypothetical protein WBK55_07370 [Alphaproteobacteria bacterium]
MGTLVTESTPPILERYRTLREEFRHAHDGGEHPYRPLSLAKHLLHSPTYAEDSKALIDALEAPAEAARIDFLVNYRGDSNIKRLLDQYKGSLESTIQEGKSLIPFEVVPQKINRIYIKVFTGHPVYGDTPERDNAISAVVSYKTGAEDYGPETLENLEESNKIPFTVPTFDEEGDQMFQKLPNSHYVRKLLQDVQMDLVRECYGDKWTTIDYDPTRDGSWHRVDWDGRLDNKWNLTLATLIELQQMMLEDYVPQLRELAEKMHGPEHDALVEIAHKLDRTCTILGEDIEYFKKFDKDNDRDWESLDEWEKMVPNKAERVTDLGEAIKVVQAVIDKNEDLDILKLAVRLRSDFRSLGMSYAEPHFRINSESVLPVMHAKEGITIEDRGTTDKHHFSKIERSAAATKEAPSDMVTVAASETMLFTQEGLKSLIKKIWNPNASFRTLLANGRNATTVGIAMQAGKEEGVLENSDYCLLIEDKVASRQAIEAMEYLYYKSPTFLENVKKRGVVSIQLGYSDYAVAAGQFAAGGFHDDTVRKLINLHADSGLAKQGVKLLIFHTGGNNIGRGNHPGGIAERQAYYMSPDNLRLAKERGVELIIETSYQGGFGQTALATKEGCLAEVVQSTAYLLTGHEKAGDIYYGPNHEHWQGIFMAARNGHEKYAGKTDDEDTKFKRVVEHFENLPPPSGSRKAKRQRQNGKKKNPRAITVNKTINNFGYSMTTLGGLRDAIERDPDEFLELALNSKFVRRHLALSVCGMHYSDPAILASYVELYNPLFWTNLAQSAKGDEKKKCYAVARDLRNFDYHTIMADVVGEITEDYDYIKSFFDETGLINHPDFQGPNIRPAADQIANIEIAHCIRLASFAKLFMHSEEIPEIPGRHDITKSDFVRGVTKYESEMLDTVTEIFRRAKLGPVKDTVRKHKKPLDYEKLTRETIDPMRQCLEVKDRVSHVIADNRCTIG